MVDIAKLRVVYEADTSNAEAGADRAQSSIGKVTTAGKLMAAAGIAAVGGFFAKSITSAASFDSAMSGAAAALGGVDVAGGITSAQLSKLSDVALDIGQNTTVGATDAARAMDLLAKGGVTYQQIMDGAALSAVQVSTATATGLDQTAESMAALTALFQQSNEQMGVSFGDMSDIVVNSMNASGMSMSEFQTGMTNLAPLVANTGIGFQEASGLISYFNAQGMAAARVGTSLTAAYTNLIAPTDTMLQQQQALGLQIYDNNGNFRGLPAILDDVKEATEGMSQADKDAAINALFGADARDVVGLALKGNKGALDAWIKSMGQSGSAEAAMATRMDNLKGDIENLKGAFETLTIRVGTAFQPVLRNVVQGLTSGVVAVTGFAQSVIALMDNGLNPVAAVFGVLQKILFDMSGSSGVLKTIANAFSHLTILAIDMGEALADVMDAFQDLRRGDFAGAWREIEEAAQTAWDAITKFAGVTLDWVLDTGIPTVTGWVVDNAADVWSGIKSLVGWAWDGLADLGGWSLNVGVPSVVGAITNIAGRLGDWLRSYIYGDGIVGDGTGGPEPGAGGGITVEIASIAIDVLDATANLTVSDVNAWLQKWIDAATGFKGAIDDWSIVLGGDPKVEGDPKGRSESSLRKALKGFVFSVPILGWAIQSTKDPDLLFDPIRMANEALLKVFRGADISVEQIRWFAHMGNPVIAFQVGWDLAKDIKAKIPPVSVSGVKWALGLALPDINLPSGDAIKAAIRVAGEAAGIPGWILDRVVGDSSPTPAMEWGGPFGQAPRSGQGSEVGSVTNGVPITTLPNTGSGSAAQGVLAQVRGIATQITSVMATIANSVRNGAQQATAALAPLGAAFATTAARATASTTQMSAQVRAQVTAMVAAARAQFTALQASTIATMTAMAAQVNAQFTQMAAQGTAQVNALRSAVQSGMQGMAAAGQSSMSQFSNSVRSGFQQAVSAAQSGVAGIRGAVNSIGSLYGQGASIGASLGQGIAAGIQGQIGAIAGAAAAAVSAALAAARNAGSIASPSKKTRDLVGIPLAQGLIVGMDSQRAAVARSFAGLLPLDARNGRGYRAGSLAYAASGSRPVYNVQIITLEPGKWQEYLKKADNGDRAYQQMSPRSRVLALGSSRK